jgi:hypothetical protein
MGQRCLLVTVKQIASAEHDIAVGGMPSKSDVTHTCRFNRSNQWLLALRSPAPPTCGDEPQMLMMLLTKKNWRKPMTKLEELEAAHKAAGAAYIAAYDVDEAASTAASAADRAATGAVCSAAAVAYKKELAKTKGQSMRILDTVGVASEMVRQKTTNANAMKPNYDVAFECGCGMRHDARSTSYILCGGINEFFFECENSWITLVKFRGFFKITPETKWSCTYADFIAAADMI